VQSLVDPISGNTLIVALDDSAICGPKHLLHNMEDAVASAVRYRVNGILGFTGMYRAFTPAFENTPFISNITLSTEGPHHLNKVQVGSIEEAIELDLAAISVHVNMTAPDEPHMLRLLGKAGRRSREADIPLLAHMYPRTILNGKEYHYQDLRDNDPDAYGELVCHGARVAVDVGNAAFVKVPWTGSAESFHRVVQSTYGRPVVMAGGPRTSVMDFLWRAKWAMEAGARGIAVGRNFFEQESIADGEFVLLALSDIVHRGMDVRLAAYRAEAMVALKRAEQALADTSWIATDTDGNPGLIHPRPPKRYEISKTRTPVRIYGPNGQDRIEYRAATNVVPLINA